MSRILLRKEPKRQVKIYLQRLSFPSLSPVIPTIRPTHPIPVQSWASVAHCHDLSGRSPHVVPDPINLSKREKDGVSSLETHFCNVYATFIPTLVLSKLDERSAHLAGPGSGALRGRPFNTRGGGYGFFRKKIICSPNWQKKIVCSIECGKKIICSFMCKKKIDCWQPADFPNLSETAKERQKFPRSARSNV